MSPGQPGPKAASTTGQPSWTAPVAPVVPDHELVRRIGGGSYGDVWLARTAVGTWRAVKIVFRDRFTDARPYEREFNGIQKFEPLSRGNEAFIDILQIGRNDAEGYFYYVMELADDASLDAGSAKLDTAHTAPADAAGESNVRRQDHVIQQPASGVQRPESYSPQDPRQSPAPTRPPARERMSRTRPHAQPWPGPPPQGRPDPPRHQAIEHR